MITQLFHYTSINNLALILKSGAIRFGRLDKVNDPTEGESEDSGSYSQYIFISCWTHNPEENLALWNMYTPQLRGVRIELPLPIFNSHKLSINTNSLISEQEYLDEEKCLFIMGGQNEPYKIEYTNDPNKLKPQVETEIFYKGKVRQGTKYGDLAHYKRTMWSIEEEYRYSLLIYPIDPKVKSSNFPDRYSDLLEQKVPPSVEGHLISINLESFKKMKIRVSPKLVDGDFEIVTALIEKYNPKAILEHSTLKGLIR